MKINPVLMWLIPLLTVGAAVGLQVEDCITDGDFKLLESNLTVRKGGKEVVGFLQYCLNSAWRTICANIGNSEDNWYNRRPNIACQHLGYSDQNASSGQSCSNSSKFIEINECDGVEPNLNECSFIETSSCSCVEGTNRANHGRLVCKKVLCGNEKFRLVGGASEREGRVEVCVDGRWGTVQTNNPGELAQTVCGSLQQSLEFYSTASCYVSQFGYSLSKPVHSCSLINNNNELTCQNHTSNSHESDLAVVCRSNNAPCRKTFQLIDDDLTCVERGLVANYSMYQELVVNNSLCADHQQGQYRVENGTVLQVCVDQQWRTAENTSQLLTLLQQEDIDQLFNKTLTQCSSTPLNNATSIPNTCTGVIQDSIDQLINEALITQCPTIRPPITIEMTALTTTIEMSTPVSTMTAQSTLSNSRNDGCTTYIGLACVLIVTLLATAAGWVVTCVVVVRKKSLSKQSSPDVTVIEIQDKPYEETTPTDLHDYSSTGPNYDTIMLNNPTECGYDVLNHSRTVESPAPVVDSNTAVREEVTDQFYDAEQHIYAAVNKKSKGSAVQKEAESEYSNI